jgi:hypothetical protein
LGNVNIVNIGSDPRRAKVNMAVVTAMPPGQRAQTCPDPRQTGLTQKPQIGAGNTCSPQNNPQKDNLEPSFLPSTLLLLYPGLLGLAGWKRYKVELSRNVLSATTSRSFSHGLPFLWPLCPYENPRERHFCGRCLFRSLAMRETYRWGEENCRYGLDIEPLHPTRKTYQSALRELYMVRREYLNPPRFPPH